MSTDDDPRPLTRRERVRRQTVDEIVTLALELVDVGGANGLSLTSLGKAMGMTPPALYHYFASREALLDAMVVAAYTDLGSAVLTVAHEVADRQAPDRVAAVAHAWRRWALDHPRRYSMLFAGGRSGTVDPLESVEPINQAMRFLVSTLQEVADQGDGSGRGSTDGDTVLDHELSRWGRFFDFADEVSAPTLRLALSTWYRVHGLVSLEVVGAFGAMRLDGGLLLTAELRSLLGEVGR